MNRKGSDWLLLLFLFSFFFSVFFVWFFFFPYVTDFSDFKTAAARRPVHERDLNNCTYNWNRAKVAPASVAAAPRRSTPPLCNLSRAHTSHVCACTRTGFSGQVSFLEKDQKANTAGYSGGRTDGVNAHKHTKTFTAAADNIWILKPGCSFTASLMQNACKNAEKGAVNHDNDSVDHRNRKKKCVLLVAL